MALLKSSFVGFEARASRFAAEAALTSKPAKKASWKILVNFTLDSVSITSFWTPSFLGQLHFPILQPYSIASILDSFWAHLLIHSFTHWLLYRLRRASNSEWKAWGDFVSSAWIWFNWRYLYLWWFWWWVRLADSWGYIRLMILSL